MAEQVTETQLAEKTYTYGVLLAKNILRNFDIDIMDKNFVDTLNNENHIHYYLLKLPYKYVFNSIILDQAQDYRVYVQKLFIDYLLSGANDAEADSPGAVLRDQLEAERLSLIALGEKFDEFVISNQRIIADAMQQLIEFYKNLSSNYANISNDDRQQIQMLVEPLMKQAEDLKKSACDYRKKFYERILLVRSMLDNAYGYRMDQEKNVVNQQFLIFDSKIGD